MPTRLHRTVVLALLVVGNNWLADLGYAQTKGEPPSVAAARKRLQTRITVDFKETRLEECLNEIKSQVDGLNFYRGAGVSNNLTITYQGKDQTVDEVLRGMFKGKGLGYVIHRATKPGDRYDGWIQIVQGDVFGEVDPPLEEKPSVKPGVQPTEKPKPEPAEKPTGKTKPEDSDKLERAARGTLLFAKELMAQNDLAGARENLELILKKYPNTKAAQEAKLLLEKLQK
ncbi:MAG: hypothetical protein RMI91_01680 [Gemmatales bacterium]|nr:hypothetical protein [Gemmatales bacterium]MDW7993336.1 hypothetical protein [Gemmatales bacterium]